MTNDNIKNFINNLPLNPGISGKDEYFNSVVLVLLTSINGEYHFIFQKRNQNIRQGGEICFPGGKHDKTKDNDFKETAVRETYEELGITKDKLNIIGRLDTIVAAMGATVDVFIGITDVTTKNMSINHDEVEEVFSIPVSYFEENNPKVYHAMIEIKSFSIDKKTGQKMILLPSKELGLPEKYYDTWGDHIQKIYVYKTDHGIIWGITARIIVDFVSKIK